MTKIGRLLPKDPQSLLSRSRFQLGKRYKALKLETPSISDK